MAHRLSSLDEERPNQCVTSLRDFPLREPLAAFQVQPTGLKREDYLTVIGGIANYFHHFQTFDGRIIDPFLQI